jgi:HrpA-like RNA helicase
MKLVNHVLSLVEVWASLAACKQRRGRAGRVQPGKAYKLYTSIFAKKHMRSYTEPEILRLPLEQLCLQIKAMDIDDVSTFLGKALSPPPTENIRFALELLGKVNAVGDDQKLTALGRHIAVIPTDIRIGKMLVYMKFI